MKSITVIGAGVVGLTTALELTRAGYKTTIVAKAFPSPELDRKANPEFASLFPAASIMPHAVGGEAVTALYSESLRCFEPLLAIPDTGVRRQRHYSLWHKGASLADHDASLIPNSEPYSRRKHPDFDALVGFDLDGWVGDVFFLETPTYLDWLLKSCKAAGVNFERRTLVPADLESLPGQLLVNCSGLGARTLVSDPEVFAAAGMLLQVQGAPFPPPKLELSSYSVDPPDSIYDAGSLYFYARSPRCHADHQGWMLGGTYEESVSGADGLWNFPEMHYAFSHGVPEPFYRLNREILLGLAGIDIGDFKTRVLRGYRPGRKSGIRLERELLSGRPIIHNYGFGGAGVTLSWGAAKRVAELAAGI